jgi:hypothetical protein
VTEAEARAALAAFDGLGGLERWIAEQWPWQVSPGGWMVPGELQGWRHFRVEPVAGGVRVVISARGGEPAVWIVPGRERANECYGRAAHRFDRRAASSRRRENANS